MYVEPRQKSKKELFAKIVHGFRWLSTLVKSSILNVRLGSEYASADTNPLLIFSENEALAYSLIKHWPIRLLGHS